MKQKKGEGCFQFMWDTLIVYGSFTEPQPDQNNHDVMFRFPNKFEVCDKSKAEFFEKRYYYISIETEVDLDISLTAISKEIPLA